MNTPRKRIVVVLGMHRSGTSAVARGLQVLGVELGERLMPAAPGNNEKGFWEDIDANALNRELLHALGREWDSLVPVSRQELEARDLRAFELRALELLRERLADKAVFGLKDPRISVLLPFWKPAFERVGAEVGYVLCSRHPLSVARSLQRRDGIEAEKSHYLWLEHVITSFLETRGAQRLVVDYDLLMEQAERQLRRIAAALHLPFDSTSPAFTEYAGGFLTDELRHTAYAPDDLRLDPAAPLEAIRAYELLERIARDELSLEDAKVGDFFMSAADGLAKIRPALAYMSRSDGRLREVKDELSVLTRAIVDKDRHITNIENSLAAREAQIRGMAEREAAMAASVRQALDERAESIEVRRALSATLASLRQCHDEDAAAAERTLLQLQECERAAGPAQAARLHAATDHLHAYADRLREASEALAEDRLSHPDEAFLRQRLAAAASARIAAFERLSACGVAFAGSVESISHELEVGRLRLLDSVRAVSRDRAELSRLAAREAELLRALAERDRLLGQFGHQFVSRFGAMLDPYPAVRWVITAPLRLLHRILGHARA